MALSDANRQQKRASSEAGEGRGSVQGTPGADQVTDQGAQPGTVQGAQPGTVQPPPARNHWMTGAVLGRTWRQSQKDSAACSTSIPRPSRAWAAPLA